MSRTSFTNALSELYGLLANATGTPVASLLAAGVTRVYSHEPKPGDTLKGCFVTVAPAGMTPTDWLIAMRVYVTWDVSAELAQTMLVNAAVAADNLMTDGWGPSSWTFEAVPEIEAFVATNLLICGRED